FLLANADLTLQLATNMAGQMSQKSPKSRAECVETCADRGMVFHKGLGFVGPCCPPCSPARRRFLPNWESPILIRIWPPPFERLLFLSWFGESLWPMCQPLR